jgi:hypothetical protein
MVRKIILFTAEVLKGLQCSALKVMDAFLLMTSKYNRKHYALISEPFCVLRPNQLVLCVRPLLDVVTCKQSTILAAYDAHTLRPILLWAEEK